MPIFTRIEKGSAMLWISTISVNNWSQTFVIIINMNNKDAFYDNKLQTTCQNDTSKTSKIYKTKYAHRGEGQG